MVSPFFMKQTKPKVYTSSQTIPNTINQQIYQFSKEEQVVKEQLEVMNEKLNTFSEKQTTELEGLHNSIEMYNKSILNKLSQLQSAATYKFRNDELSNQYLLHQMKLFKEMNSKSGSVLVKLLKELVPSTKISKLYVEGATIEVNTFIEFREPQNIGTFVLPNGNTLIIDCNKISGLEILPE